MKYLLFLLLLLATSSHIYGEQKKNMIEKENSKLIQDRTLQYGFPSRQQEQIEMFADVVQTLKNELKSEIEKRELAEVDLYMMMSENEKNIENLHKYFSSSIKHLQMQSNNYQKEIDSLTSDIEETGTYFSEEINHLSQKSKEINQKIIKSENAISLLEEDLSLSANELQQHNMMFQDQEKKIDELVSEIDLSKSEFHENADNIRQSLFEVREKINVLGDETDARTTKLGYWTFLAGLIGASGIVLGFVMRRKYFAGSEHIEKDLLSLRRQVDEDSVKLDNKFIELLQNQMKLVEESSSKTGPEPFSPVLKPDHSLPIRVGEEILRIRNRLDSLPSDTKGLKPMVKSLERLEAEFNKNGYEIVDMLGQQFVEGQQANARFVPVDHLGPDDRIISKVIKPQINFNGTAIQHADIEVSTGEETNNG